MTMYFRSIVLQIHPAAWFSAMMEHIRTEMYGIVHIHVVSDHLRCPIEPHLFRITQISGRIEVQSVMQHHYPSGTGRHTVHQFDRFFGTRFFNLQKSGTWVDVIEIILHFIKFLRKILRKILIYCFS